MGSFMGGDRTGTQNLPLPLSTDPCNVPRDQQVDRTLPVNSSRRLFIVSQEILVTLHSVLGLYVAPEEAGVRPCSVIYRQTTIDNTGK
jgi:hypothetical protein